MGNLVDVDMDLLALLVCSIFHLIVGLFGATTNILSILAFQRIHQDSITICLYLQARVDLTMLLFNIATSVIAFLDLDERFYKRFYPVQMKSISLLFNIVMRIFLESSYNLTAFLAIQRCICVIKPLQFTTMFTKRKIYMILTPIVIFHCLNFVFLLSFHGFQKEVNSFTNLTQYVVFYRPERQVIRKIMFIIYGISLTVINHLIIAFCVFVLARALVRSIKFRNKANNNAKLQRPLGPNVLNKPKDNGDQRDNQESHRTQETIAILRGRKELRVILQVSLLCVIYLTCSIPKICLTFAIIFVTGFVHKGSYNKIYMICYYIMLIFENLNGSLNFFVYYKYNSKFREAYFHVSRNKWRS